MKSGYFHKIIKNHRGVTVIFVAVVLLVMIGMASLAIDIGYVAVKKTELQNAADAAALAAAMELGGLYPISDPLNETYKAQVVAVAEEIATSNITENLSIQVEFENSQGDTEGPDAVNVTLQTHVNLFFAKVLGVSSKTVKAHATAALTSIVWIPIGISSAWLGSFMDHCRQMITLYPLAETCDSSAAWHTFGLTADVTADDIEDTLRQIYGQGDQFQPGVSSGDVIEFTRTTGPEENRDVYDWFRVVYEVHGYDIDVSGNPIGPSNPVAPIPKMVPGTEIQDTWFDPITGDSDIPADEHELTANVLVFDPNGTCVDGAATYNIVGYAKVTIREVYRKLGKQIVAEVRCSPYLVE